MPTTWQASVTQHHTITGDRSAAAREWRPHWQLRTSSVIDQEQVLTRDGHSVHNPIVTVQAHKHPASEAIREACGHAWVSCMVRVGGEGGQGAWGRGSRLRAWGSRPQPWRDLARAPPTHPCSPPSGTHCTHKLPEWEASYLPGESPHTTHPGQGLGSCRRPPRRPGGWSRWTRPGTRTPGLRVLHRSLQNLPMARPGHTAAAPHGLRLKLHAAPVKAQAARGQRTLVVAGGGHVPHHHSHVGDSAPRAGQANDSTATLACPHHTGRDKLCNLNEPRDSKRPHYCLGGHCGGITGMTCGQSSLS
jgi:hypothetical protein